MWKHLAAGFKPVSISVLSITFFRTPFFAPADEKSLKALAWHQYMNKKRCLRLKILTTNDSLFDFILKEYVLFVYSGDWFCGASRVVNFCYNGYEQLSWSLTLASHFPLEDKDKPCYRETAKTFCRLYCVLKTSSNSFTFDFDLALILETPSSSAK